jgi:hypothetical protein
MTLNRYTCPACPMESYLQLFHRGEIFTPLNPEGLFNGGHYLLVTRYCSLPFNLSSMSQEL